MAFLCPVRFKGSAKKKSFPATSGYASEGEEKVGGRTPAMGRITGSASIETLVRVGLEKEAGVSPDAKVVILQDFTPCVDDELGVKRGNVVTVLYAENNWCYVLADDGEREGFVPESYCLPLDRRDTILRKKKLPREGAVEPPGDPPASRAASLELLYDFDNPTFNSDSDPHSCALPHPQPHTPPDVQPFSKKPSGHYIVLYTFTARDENDVAVERGEFVTVLNQEDPDWAWVLRADGQEGFVPSGFVYPADVIQGHLAQNNSSLSSGECAPPSSLPHTAHSPPKHSASIDGEEIGVHGSELVMLYDYKPQATDDLAVRRGEWVYADLEQQTIDGWLWAYSAKANKCGFIPKAYARPPAMTSL